MPVPGPVKTPVFMHSAKALSQELLSNFLAALARLIPSLHACAPVEHDVGCRWAEAAEGTRSIAAAMSSLYIAMGRSFQGCHKVKLILVLREMLRVHCRQPQPLRTPACAFRRTHIVRLGQFATATQAMRISE